MSGLSAVAIRRRLRETREDYVFTQPAGTSSPAFALDAAEAAAAGEAVAALTATGAFVAGVKLEAATLAAVRTALDEAYRGRRRDRQIVTNERMGIERILNPLRLHPVLVALATDRALGRLHRCLRRRSLRIGRRQHRRPGTAGRAAADRRLDGADPSCSWNSEWHDLGAPLLTA